jgi:hypothetical protein
LFLKPNQLGKFTRKEFRMPRKIYFWALLFLLVIGLVTSSNAQAAAAVGPGISGTQITSEACIHNTADEGQCKDCCDSLDADGSTRKSCRDSWPVQNFSQNNALIHFG